MSKKSEKYGVYYGEIVNYKDNNNILFNGFDKTPKIMDKLYSYGVLEIYFDFEDGYDNYSSTLFFETDKNTDFKSLMVYIINLRPDEFTEETTNHFRMWFD